MLRQSNTCEVDLARLMRVVRVVVDSSNGACSPRVEMKDEYWFV
jgi:hypothetical protein